jgi:hypothetical protein
MDPDFTALASRLAARAEVLGCVILSRDGLVLGAFPPHGEQDITPGLLRFAALGDPERGFAQFSDELWAFVRAGAYAAFAVAEHGTRPGVLLDYLEQALLVAEEARLERSAVSEPVAVDLDAKGIRAGRKLRAATSAADEFRAAVFATERRAERGGRADDTPAAPGLDDGALDEALAAALAAGDGPESGAVPAEQAFLEAPAPPEHSVEELSPAAFQEGEQDPWQTPGARWEGSEDGAAGPAEPHDEEPAPEWHHEQAPEDTTDHEAERMQPAAAEHEAQHEAAPEEPADEAPMRRPPSGTGNPDEIDRVALAREFAQLLQEGPGGAEAGP